MTDRELLEAVIIDYARCVDGEWGECRTPGSDGWDEYLAEFRADLLARVSP